MNAEFNWWLLIVGLVAGAGLVWLVIADWRRRELDMAEDEIAVESAWIAQVLRERGEHLDPQTAEEILQLHRTYLREAGVLQFATVDDVGGTTTEYAPYGGTGPEPRAASASARDPQHDVDDASDASLPVRRRSVRDTPLAPRGGPSIDDEDGSPGA